MKVNRRELKNKAKQTIKTNRINIIIVCFLIAVVAAGYSSSTLGFSFDESDLNLKTPNIGSTKIEEIFTDVHEDIVVKDKFNLRHATRGAMATIINNSGASKSFVVGLLNTINKIVFDNKILEGTIMSIVTLLTFLFYIFVQNILLVGECRFFLEAKNYEKTNVKKLLFIYRVKKLSNVAKIMFFKSIYMFLWSFTIIGGIIKHYSYKMIPYILAENPEIKRKDAFKLSKMMMKGSKWEAFKLDLSFILLNLLSLMTFGVVGFVYGNPLIGATMSEFYYLMREKTLAENNILAIEYLKDIYLLEKPEDRKEEDRGYYPTELYFIPEISRHDFSTLEYDKDYSITSLVYIFFGIAFIGWCWEVFLYILNTGHFVNRGMLKGPWLPIYGFGSLLVIILLKKLRNKPAEFFIASFIVCGNLEYFTSWIMEKIFNKKWWDYSDIFFNINGRVSLEGLLFFATGASLIVYIVAPLIDELIEKIPLSKRNKIAIILIVLFMIDVVTGFFRPNYGDNITVYFNILSRIFV